MTARSPLLKILNLHVSFAKQPVLHGVNLHLFKGESLALIGESGSGKSVTAQAILRLLGPHGAITQGEIWLAGEPLHARSEKEMRKIRGKKIGMIFQDPLSALNPLLTIGRQIQETLLAHIALTALQAHLRTCELLERVGIADPEKRRLAYPFQLSGGMRQRVMIAIALAGSPDLLIADEPTTALDATVQSQILALLQSIQQETKMGLLLITHDLGIVADLCERAAVMHQGKIVEMGEVSDLFTRPQHPYTETLLAAGSERQ